MTIEFKKVQIRVSELQTNVVAVAPWEVAVLQAIYGEDEAKVVGTMDIDRAAPEPADEFARLAVRYGPKHAEMPVVAAVYGKFGPGVAALAQAIEKACGEVGTNGPLSDEQIDAISAEGDEAQAQVSAADIEDLL
jgi:hypothetical protein